MGWVWIMIIIAAILIVPFAIRVWWINDKLDELN